MRLRDLHEPCLPGEPRLASYPRRARRLAVAAATQEKRAAMAARRLSAERAVRSDDRQVGEVEPAVIAGAVADLQATDVITLERLEAALEALPRDDLAFL